jgi:hypothetical protein
MIPSRWNDFFGSEIHTTMQRRSLIKKAALAGAAGATAAAEKALPQAVAGQRRSILITSGHHRLAQLLADDLSADHHVLLTARTPVTTQHRFQQSNLGHEAPTNELVRDIDSIVHVAEPLPSDDLTAQIDQQTRCTYNLLLAASQANVRRVVYLSTLKILTAYDADFLVDETWAPRPALTGPSLPKYLGEYTCREFARVSGLEVTVLRLGTLLDAGKMRGEIDPLWLSEQDAVRAVRLALNREAGTGANLSKWSVIHIASKSPNARFRIAKANRALGYEPEY